ncbi:hypothetical protein DFR86_07575 [Acidianus sulfidivorans JP7]|uniref:Uncharacterized protein n=1 Tax=Acidianus sulfidivorans JP7 TaxID=619593 RepID=A0A2U9IN42_9CREN|nr:hypothetical protein [Acidianus sulfidivorans]AWR97422.1 hypothetical protein DFR86_07575 [Acidianus sulfidivorans JP7]
MDIAFDDIIDVGILRAKYYDYKSSIKSNFVLAIKDFLSFVSYVKMHTKSSKLLEILREQEKISKRILLIYKIRFVLLIIYKNIIDKLINKLIGLINIFISML